MRILWLILALLSVLLFWHSLYQVSEQPQAAALIIGLPVVFAWSVWMGVK